MSKRSERKLRIGEHLKIKTVSCREARKILRANGYIYDSCNGSHFHYVKDGDTIIINKDLNKMVWRRLVKEHSLIV